MQAQTTPPWRDQLIAEHTGMARRIALKLARRCPNWIAREDLVAAGMLGLTEAARRYDDTRAEPFVPFAEQRIRGAVLDELRRGDLLPRRVRQLARKIASTIRTLEARGGTATDQAIADSLGVSIEAYREDLAHLVHVDVSSLDDSERVVQLPNDDDAPDELAARRLEMARVRGALSLLEPRDAALLGLYYLEDLTFQQIATSLGITSSRACQLLWRAVDRLRARLGDTVGAEAA
jgi:RNA polymerase sigma factor for flagellar operon FliA